MKKQIITGAICGGIGLLVGCKLTTKKVMKLLSSDELKQQIIKELENEMSGYQRNKNTYQDIVFETRTDAMKALEDLKDIIDKYKVASVADLYDISGLTSSFVDNKRGWVDVSNAEVYFNKDGYSLKMPKTITLK